MELSQLPLVLCEYYFLGVFQWNCKYIMMNRIKLFGVPGFFYSFHAALRVSNPVLVHDLKTSLKD